MTLLSELLTLNEGRMKDLHLDAQEKIEKMFGFGETEAMQVMEFALGQRDWEDLGDDSRERLYSHYENAMPYGTRKARTGDPAEFIGKALTADLGL